MRVTIAAIVPRCGVGNSMAMLLAVEGAKGSYAQWAPLLLANLNSFAYDFALRQKAQGQNLNWFIIEQSVVIAPELFEQDGGGGQKLGDLVRQAVSVLTFTASDVAAFGREAAGLWEPVRWNGSQRRKLLVALDALFFHLYGLDAAAVDYIMDTFPIVRDMELRPMGTTRSKPKFWPLTRNSRREAWPDSPRCSSEALSKRLRGSGTP
jgi:hypothetical protein